MLNTLVHDKPVSVGSQWVVFVPTDIDTGEHNGPTCTHSSLILPLNTNRLTFTTLDFKVFLFEIIDEFFN